jgi:hypothetical protein
VRNAEHRRKASLGHRRRPARQWPGRRRRPGGRGHRERRGQHPKARAAALAKYPGATIQRVETDSDGVYEAHLGTKDGKRVTVEMDKNFTVTGEEAHGSR